MFTLLFSKFHISGLGMSLSGDCWCKMSRILHENILFRPGAVTKITNRSIQQQEVVLDSKLIADLRFYHQHKIITLSFQEFSNFWLTDLIILCSILILWMS